MVEGEFQRGAGRMLFNPSPEEKIEPGDRLVALGETLRLKELERRVGVPSPSSLGTP